MKKFLSIVSALCMVCAVMPVTKNTIFDSAVLSAHAYEEVTEGMLTFRKYDDHAEVYKCDTLAVKVEIPSEIDGLPVTVVDGFNYCSELTSVTIPDSVTSIGDRAFEWCINLISIEIPNGVTSIGKSTFSTCSSLTSFTIPDSVTSIGDNAFEYCSNLTSITIPNNVVNIGAGAFDSCHKLTSVTILNPYCEIYSSYYTLGGTRSMDNTSITIYGENLSTAQAYAEEYGYSFATLDDAPEPETNNDIAYMEENKITLDFNKDGVVNTKDAAWILVYSAEYGAGNVKSLEEFFQKNQVN